MGVYNGKVDFYFEQIGIDCMQPSFSWKTTTKQSAYQIIAAKSLIELEKEKSLIWDTGKTVSQNHIGITYGGKSLESIQEYYWKVKVWDEKGTCFESRSFFFVTGFITEIQGRQNFLGNWISNKTAKPFYARKEFSIQHEDKKIKSAYALVSGLGHFEMEINGRKVGDHVFDPGWTNYDKKVQYVMFDIKKYLEQRNAIAIEVGNGWYVGETKERYFFSMPPKDDFFSFMPPNPNPYQPFSDYLALCGTFVVIYEDGSRQVIKTDESFRVCKSATKLANVFGSEILDGREVLWGHSRVGYDDKDWEMASVLAETDAPRGKLRVQNQPPVIVKETYEPIAMTEQEKGQVLIDFGQNMAGLFAITVKATDGQRIDLYPAEKLDENGNADQYAKGWTPVNTYSTYITCGNGREETYCPRFSYSAGRYVLVKGVTLKREAFEYPQLLDAKAYFTTSASNDTGRFQADDKRYEQIYHLVKKAVESNLFSVHTDCPSIEKIAWQEPNHLMGPSIMYMKDVSSLWYKIMDDLRRDQWKEGEHRNGISGSPFYFGEGFIPSQSPCYEPNIIPVPGMGSFFDIIPWGSSIILSVYWHYIFYGNIQIIKENYEAGKKYLSYLKTKINEEGFINHGLGDWGNPNEDNLARENIETAFLYADAVTLAKFSHWLGKENEADEFEEFAKTVKDNYNKKLLVKHPTEGFFCYKAFDHPDEMHMTQACEALPLYWGIVPEDKKEDVAKAFDYILTRDDAIISGEVGLPYIIQTMREQGMNEKIISFIMKEQHPSYYAFVLGGETTLPEYWEENARSHNHDMLGHIIEWYYNGILGILPEEPGFSKVTIRPWMPEGVNKISGCYASVQGDIEVSMSEEADELLVNIRIPACIDVTVDDTLLKNDAYKEVHISLINTLPEFYS